MGQYYPNVAVDHGYIFEIHRAIKVCEDGQKNAPTD